MFHSNKDLDLPYVRAIKSEFHHPTQRPINVLHILGPQVSPGDSVIHNKELATRGIENNHLLRLHSEYAAACPF